MNSFETSVESKKISQEKVSEHIDIYEGAIENTLKVLNMGSMNLEGTFDNWPVDAIKGFCESIIAIFNAEIKTYKMSIDDEIENVDKIQKKIDSLATVLSELDGLQEVPDGFLEKIKSAL